MLDMLLAQMGADLRDRDTFLPKSFVLVLLLHDSVYWICHLWPSSSSSSRLVLFVPLRLVVRDLSDSGNLDQGSIRIARAHVCV